LFPLNKPMIIFDLAVPADVDDKIGQLPNVKLFNITDIENKFDQNIDKRLGAIKKAEKIIDEEIKKYLLKEKRNLCFAVN
jgi:glutamyl-tRNA reductase